MARVGRVVVVVLGGFILAVALTALISPRAPFTIYRQPVVVGTTVSFLLIALMWRPASSVRRILSARWTPWGIALGGGLLAFVVGTSLRFPWSWDVGAASAIASGLHLGEPLTERQVEYLSRYPNTHSLVVAHRLSFDVADVTGSQPRTVLIVLLAVAAGLTVLLVHRLVAPVSGSVRAGTAQLVTVALVAISPWMAVPYTDVLAMPMLTGAVVLVLEAVRRPGGLALVQLACAAVLAAGSIALKTTPVVLLVVVAVCGLLLAVDQAGRSRRMVVVVASTIVWCAVTIGLVAVLTTSSTAAVCRSAPGGSCPNASPPTLWWVANGMTQTQSPGNPPRYGGYNVVMVRAVADLDRVAATSWSQEWIAARWAQLGERGLATFYANKAAWNWGDGMFWAWGEGRDAVNLTMPPTDGVAGFVVDVNGRFGQWYQLRSDITQGLWLALLLATGLGAVRWRAPRFEVVFLALTLLGVALFTLLFQGRSRYLLTFVPLVVALAAMVGPRVTARRRP